MVMKRGEVWWADSPEPRGSEPGFRRPVLIVQADPFNRSRIGTVVVAVITSNCSLAEAPGNVRLSRRQSKLPRESVVSASQVMTLARSFLSAKVGRVPAAKMEDVDAGLRLVLAL